MDDYDVPPTPSRFDLTFTTGSGPAQADATAAPGQVTAGRQDGVALSPECLAALSTQDCFDTGQNTQFTFTPTGSAKGWLMVSESGYSNVNLWPGECGAPRLFLHDFPAPCVTLHGIDASGATHAGERVCASEAGAPAPPLDASTDAGTRPDVALTSDTAARAADLPDAEVGCAFQRAGRSGAPLLVSALLAVGLLGARRREAHVAGRR
jgi:hypothetical protein